jgi:hypothetical protein
MNIKVQDCDTSWHTQQMAQSGGGAIRRSSREGSGSETRRFGYGSTPSGLCLSCHLLDERSLRPFTPGGGCMRAFPSVAVRALVLPLTTSPPLLLRGAREGGCSSPK